VKYRSTADVWPLGFIVPGHPGAVSTPKIFEPRWRQLGVPHRVLDVLVAQVGLQRACIMTIVGKLEARGVPEHVRVGLDLQVRPAGGSRDNACEAGSGERGAALAGENEG
jgi:hypothetical protein